MKAMKVVWRIALAVVSAAVVTVLAVWQASGFVPDKVPPGESAGTPTERAILESLTLEATTVPRFHEVVGSIQSRDEVDVSPRITARIVQVTRYGGDEVAKGDTLVVLDDTDLRAGYEAAKQALDASKSALETSKSAEIGAKAAYDVAEKDYERMKRLVESGTVPKSRFDQAEGDYLKAKAMLAQAASGILVAGAEVRRAAENLNAAKATLDYTVIKAPLSGIVSERLADPGDMATVGNPVLKVFDPARLMLEAGVREDLVGRVKKGMVARFDVQALGKEYQGDIREIVPSVDPASRTFLVKVCLGEAAELMPGMFGRLYLPVGDETMLRFPQRYLTRIGQLEYVFVKTPEGPRRRLVKTVPDPGGMLKVLSGLSAGETIVLLGEKSS